MHKILAISVLASIFVSAVSSAHPTSALSACVNITHDLQLESRDDSTGGDVSRLQDFLSQDSQIYPEKKIDGYYGPATRLAVYRWQKANKVSATTLGNVDAKTRAALGNCKRVGLVYQATYAQQRSKPLVTFGNNGCPVFSRTLSRGSRGTDVQALQSFLIGKNLLSTDSVSGFFGAMTEEAVQQWQTSVGIISSGDASTGFGVLGPKTRSALATNCTQEVTNSENTALATTPARSVNCLNAQPVICQVGYIPGGICNLQCVIDPTPPPQWVIDMLHNPSPSPSPTPPTVATPPVAPSPSPSPSPTSSPTPSTPPVQFSQSGTAANLTVSAVNGSYTVTFSGTYNSNGLCDNAQFNLGYGDESSDTFSTSCTAKQYSKTHTFPGPGTYDAYIAKITTNSGGVQTFDYQAEVEIIINNNGTVLLGVVPPDTSASILQTNVASALTGLEYAIKALLALLNR